MKVGDKRSEESMEICCTAREYERGRLVFKHPRLGRVAMCSWNGNSPRWWPKRDLEKLCSYPPVIRPRKKKPQLTPNKVPWAP